MPEAFNYGETSGGGSSSSRSSSQGGTLPFYNRAVEDLLKRGQQQSLTPYQGYGGQLVAGFSPVQNQAFGALQGAVGQWQPGLNAAQGGLGQAQNIFGGLLNSPYTAGALGQMQSSIGTAQYNPNQIGQYMNPYISNVVNEIGRLGNQNFQQNTLADLNSSFGDAGQFGSARNMMMASDAAAKAQREISAQQGQALNTGFNNAMANYGQWADRGIGASQNATNQFMGLNQFTQGLGTSMGGLAGQQAGIAGQRQQMGLTDVNALFGAGQQQQAQTQRGLDTAYQQWQQQQQYPWQQINNYAKLFEVPTPQQQQSSNSSGSSNYSNNWSTSFKQGGLVRAANGGMIDDLIAEGLAGNTPMELAQDAMNLRGGFMDYVRRRPEFEPIPEQSQVGRIGDAMFRAAAAGPASMGQRLGRAGMAYMDQETARQKENQARAVAQLNIMENSLPSASATGLGLGRASATINNGKMPSPEQVRAVFSTALNNHAQAAKEIDWKKKFGDRAAEARMAWIRDGATQDVRTYIDNFATQPTGPRGTAGEVPAAPMSAPTASAEATAVASANAAAGAPPVAAPQAPGTFALEMDKLPPETAKEVNTAIATLKGPALEAKLQEIAARGAPAPAAPVPTPTPAPAAPVASAPAAPFRDRPAEKMAAASAEGVGKSAADDFDAVQKMAASARMQHAAYNQLEKVAPKTGKFANIYQFAGDVLRQLGQDPNTPLIQDAIKNREADVILNQMRNAALRAEKGIQTASDEKRIAAELAKTTDQSEAWRFITKLGKERAARTMDMGNYYTSFAEGNSGNVVGATSSWDKDMREDPLTQDYGGKTIFRSDFLAAYQRKYPEATKEDAIAEWKQLEAEFQERSRRRR